jgi:diamine N-acetyltransferase
MSERPDLRIASLGDGPMLAELGRRSFFEAFGEYNEPEDMKVYLDTAFDPAAIIEQLKNPACIFIVAEINNNPVGYAKLKLNSHMPQLENFKSIQLERIYALRDYIGKKIGKSLMEKCFSIARKESFNKIWLSVWQQNTRAIDFYKKWNFEIIGTKQFVIGNEVNDDFVMAADL